MSVLTRRSSGARRASAARFLGPLLAEHAGEIGIEPFRIVARDPGRRARQVGGLEPCALGLVSGAARMTHAVGQPRDRGGVEPTLEAEHAEHGRARRVCRP